MPALHGRAQLAADVILRKAEVPGHAKGNIQKTVIDGLELNSHLAPVAHNLFSAVAGHTLHGFNLPATIDYSIKKSG